MRIVHCKNWEEVLLYKEAWSDLQAKCEVPIFSTVQFLTAYWSRFSNFNHPKFGRDKKVHVLFFFYKDDLVGVLPMMTVIRRRKKIIPLIYLELMGQHFFTSSLDILCKEDFPLNWKSVEDYIQRNIRHHVINFQLINENSKLFCLLNGSAKELVKYSVSPTIVNHESLTFEAYKKTVMSVNFQKILNNSRNRFLKTNKPFHFAWENYDEAAHFDLVDKISDSKKLDGKYNVYAIKEMREFVQEIYKMFQGRICTLYLDQVPIAYQVYIYFANQCMWFDLSYDRAFRDLRPGIMIYEEGLREHMQFVNILGYGSDQNKLGLCNEKVSVFSYSRTGNIRGSNLLLFLLNRILK